jgi:type II secretory pathway pseudopilin PulG
MINKKASGFSLLEVSIMLIILGIIATGAFSFIAIEIRKQSIITTNKKLDVIEDALLTYLAVNGRLPCPASPWQIASNTTFALERRISSTNCESTASTSIMNNGEHYLGAVPTRALGISEEYMFDAWGNRISYVVQRAFVNNELTNVSCITDGKNAANNNADIQYLCFKGQSQAGATLQVSDASGNLLSNPVYILLSHGENGNGAFLNSSDVDVDIGETSTTSIYRKSTPADAGELSNAGYASNASWSLNSLQNNFIMMPRNQNFDDILRFKTRNKMILECNLYGGGNICSDPAQRGIYVR